MRTVENNKVLKWAEHLDKAILYLGAAVPVGIIIGTIGFEIITGLTGFLWLIRAFLLKKNPFSDIFMNPAIIAWAGWLLCIFLSLAVNGPGSKGLWHDIVYFRFFIYASALIDLSTRKNITAYLLWGLALGVLFGAFNTITAYVIGFDLLGRPWERYTIKLRTIAQIAALGSMAAPIFLGLAMAVISENSKNWRLLFFICIIATLNTIQSQVRTAIIALFTGILFAFMYDRYKKMNWPEKILWPILTGIGIWFTINTFGNWSFGSFYDRIYIWKVSLAMFTHNLLLGVGISSWADTYSVFANSGIIDPYLAKDGIVYAEKGALHAHNLILMLLSSSGILGTLAFLSLFTCCILTILKSNSIWKAGLITWPVVFMIGGLTGWSIYHSSYQIVFTFFAVLALTSENENMTPKNRTLRPGL
jgi:O-antigen ligase